MLLMKMNLWLAKRRRKKMESKILEIEGLVKSEGYYTANMKGRWNCHLMHFDIDGEDLASIIGDFFGEGLDDGMRLHIIIEKVEE